MNTLYSGITSNLEKCGASFSVEFIVYILHNDKGGNGVLIGSTEGKYTSIYIGSVGYIDTCNSDRWRKKIKEKEKQQSWIIP